MKRQGDRPTKIFIDPFWFEITYDHTELAVYMLDERSIERGAWGYCDHQKGRIFLDDSVPEDRVKATLLHELLHAAWFAAGLDSMKEEMLTEEIIVNALSLRISTMFENNPPLVDYLRS